MMTLSASLVEPLSYAPAGSLLDASARVEDLGALVDCLANRFGPSRLYRAALAESDLPERSVALIPPLDPPRGKTWDPALPRPSRLLSPPEPVETTALLPDHPPALFVWRGARHRVRHMDGPERIYGEWWSAMPRPKASVTLSRRGRNRIALLAVSRRLVQRGALVPAWALRMATPNCRSPPLLISARRVERGELFVRALELGIPALGVCDRNSLAGIVRAYEAAEATKVRLVVGSALISPTIYPCWSIRLIAPPIAGCAGC